MGRSGGTMGDPQLPPGFDFTDPDLYSRRVPAEEFAELRRTAPVWWNSQPRGSAGFDDEGYWVVTRHADIVDISRNSDLFGSWENTAIIRLGQLQTEESLAMQRLIMLNIDPPQHTKLRAIISRGFTPRAIGNLRDVLRERAERIVATAVSDGTGDFVADVASELPLQAIAELLGYAMLMAEDRRQCPRDDIVTKLVNAQIDGGELSSDEFGFFMILLSVAGNETTRNAISHGMLAFFDHPDQWELYRAERPE